MHLPKIFRFRSSQLSANQYFLISLVGGFLISFYWPSEYIIENCENLQQTSDTSQLKNADYNQLLNEDFDPVIADKKPVTSKKAKTITRPRYYHTELNVRQDRLFVGVLTTQVSSNP